MKKLRKGFLVSVKEIRISFSYIQINLLETEKQVNMWYIASEFAEPIIMHTVTEIYYTTLKISYWISKCICKKKKKMHSI